MMTILESTGIMYEDSGRGGGGAGAGYLTHNKLKHSR